MRPGASRKLWAIFLLYKSTVIPRSPNRPRYFCFANIQSNSAGIHETFSHKKFLEDERSLENERCFVFSKIDARFSRGNNKYNNKYNIRHSNECSDLAEEKLTVYNMMSKSISNSCLAKEDTFFLLVSSERNALNFHIWTRTIECFCTNRLRSRSLRDPTNKNYFSFKYCSSLDVERYRISNSCCSFCGWEYVSCLTR